MCRRCLKSTTHAPWLDLNHTGVARSGVIRAPHGVSLHHPKGAAVSGNTFFQFPAGPIRIGSPRRMHGTLAAARLSAARTFKAGSRGLKPGDGDETAADIAPQRNQEPEWPPLADFATSYTGRTDTMTWSGGIRSPLKLAFRSRTKRSPFSPTTMSIIVWRSEI